MQSTIKFLQRIADKFGYKLNPNEKTFGQIATYMTKNKEQYGKYFCPCKQHFPLDNKKDPVCPCIEFHEEIKNNGYCECHLFFDEEASIKAKQHPGLLSTITCPG